jgi:hypothetical protein
MLKTHDLINCNPLLPITPSVNDSGIYPYNGQIVRFDENNDKTFTVKKNVQARFSHPEMPVNEGNVTFPDGTRVVFQLTSIKYQGTEFIVGTPTIDLIFSDLVYTSYPYYSPGNEYSYTNNVANAAIVSSSPIDLGNNYNNFYQWIESFIVAYGIPVNIVRTPSLWWTPDDFLRLDNFTIEKHYDVDFEFTIEANYYDLTDDSLFLTQENRHVFDGEDVFHYVDGIDIIIVSGPGLAPQFSDEYSLFSYNYNYETIEQINACPTFVPFNASMRKDGCPATTVDCDCTKISFSDTSNYSNSIPGHNPEFFTTRKFTITRPDGTTYILGTAGTPDVDQVIPPHFNSSNNFVYEFVDSDVDGVYEIELCTYPDWQDDVLYQSYSNTIVNRNGKLYKVIATNSNADPSLSSNSIYWSEYTCDGDCDKTRYCTKERIVVLCISLLKCYKSLVKSALCEVDAAPCAKNLCDNKKFMDAMKFKVTLDAVEFSACDEKWDLVKDQVDLLKSICCCDS